MVLHFSRGVSVPDELNVVLLMTDGNGRYRSTGLVKEDGGDGKPKFYSLGDNLEIIVNPSADHVIRELPRGLQ